MNGISGGFRVVAWLLSIAWFGLQAIVIISSAYEHRYRVNELQLLEHELSKIEEMSAMWEAELQYLQSLYVVEQQSQKMGLFYPQSEAIRIIRYNPKP